MDYQFLQKTPLFCDSSIDEIKSMLNCLEAGKKKFAKGDVIYRAGDTVQSMGLVLSGRVQIENDDLWGNKSVLDSIAPGMVFAETYAFLPGEPLMVSAVASEPSEILFLNGARILQSCPNACIHHSKLIRRLLTISSPKKPESFQTDFPYLRQNHPRTPGILPLRPGRAIPKPGLHDPL